MPCVAGPRAGVLVLGVRGQLVQLGLDLLGLGAGGVAFAGDGGDAGAEFVDQAVAVVIRHRKASTSFFQRQLQIGYNRAARLMEQMEEQGVVGPANQVGRREILEREGAED